MTKMSVSIFIIFGVQIHHRFIKLGTGPSLACCQPNMLAVAKAGTGTRECAAFPVPVFAASTAGNCCGTRLFRQIRYTAGNIKKRLD
jgi:hypothetical protein